MGTLTAIRTEPADPAVFPTRVERLEYTSGVDGAADWAMVWPGQSTERWIVKVHGHGSHGDQLWTRPDLRDQWLPAFRDTGASILSPNLRDNAWMGPKAATDLHDLLSFVRSQYGAREFIFASGSMGGTSNLVYAVLHPQDVAAVVALCAVTDMGPYYRWCRASTEGPASLEAIADAIQDGYGGTPDELPDVYQTHSTLEHAQRLTMPTMLVHGTADEIIPVDESRRLAERLDGVDTFRYVEMPDGHHDSPLVMCVEALEWVMDRM